jgi:hypothetical protein
MMEPTHTVDAAGEIDAPAEAVWDRIAAHERTHTWVLLARVRILTPGVPPPNGLGTVREVAFPGRRLWTTIQERIVAWDPPRSFSYTIIKGMPGIRDHLGTLSVEPLGEARSRLTWHIDFAFVGWHPMGWIAGRFTKAFGLVLEAAIAELGRQMRR